MCSHAYAYGRSLMYSSISTHCISEDHACQYQYSIAKYVGSLNRIVWFVYKRFTDAPMGCGRRGARSKFGLRCSR